MSKFTEDDIIDCLNLSGITGEPRQTLLKKLQMIAKEKEEERLANKPIRRKNAHVVVLKGVPEGVDTKDIVASVYTMPEDQDAATLLDRIRAAAVDSNIANSNKKKKNLLKTFTDTLLLKAKFAKAREFKPLVREWVRTLVVTSSQDDNFITTQAVKTEDFS